MMSKQCVLITGKGCAPCETLKILLRRANIFFYEYEFGEAKTINLLSKLKAHQEVEVTGLPTVLLVQNMVVMTSITGFSPKYPEKTIKKIYEFLI
jgi:hypothetical protein